MNVTQKEARAFNAMIADKWAPYYNDNANIAKFGMGAARFNELRRHIADMYGMKDFWPRKFTVLAFHKDIRR